ncbi:hypothetical protein EJB05_56177, partial [Eragrostis curvula]
MRVIKESHLLLAGNTQTMVVISTALVVSTTVVAATVGFFGYLMPFFGSFLSVMDHGYVPLPLLPQEMMNRVIVAVQ